MPILPENNNLCAIFSGARKAAIRPVFEAQGWQGRKCSWADVELTNSWSELTLFGTEDEPLASGLVMWDNNRLARLDSVLRLVPGYCSYEFYDDNQNLLLEKRIGD